MLSQMETQCSMQGVSFYARSPSLPISQMQDEKLQDKKNQPVSKLIERNRLKMVRCSILAPA